MQKLSDHFDHLSKVEHFHADFKNGFRFEVAHPKNVRHHSKVSFSKLTTVRVARFDQNQVEYLISIIACYFCQWSFLGIKCINFLKKFQFFEDTLKLTFISDLRKFVRGGALFCEVVGKKFLWHFDFYLNAQLLPGDQNSKTTFIKIVPP